MSGFKKTMLIMLAFLVIVFSISCQHFHLVSSESNVTYYDLKEGENTQINLPKIDARFNYAVFRFPTEPGKIYEITIECSTDISIYRENLTKERYQVLYKENWGNTIGDTMVFGVDKPGISELKIAVTDTGSTIFNIQMSTQNRNAWWVMPKDSIKDFHFNGNSQINSRNVIPYESSMSIDTINAWETRGFLMPDVNESIRYQYPSSSVSIISDWFHLKGESEYQYMLHLQFVRGYSPFVDFTDKNGNIFYPKILRSSCNEYAVCQIDFNLQNLVDDTIYIRFYTEYQFLNFFDSRYRFGVERISRSY